jgi:hypothetical protein
MFAQGPLAQGRRSGLSQAPTSMVFLGSSRAPKNNPSWTLRTHPKPGVRQMAHLSWPDLSCYRITRSGVSFMNCA